MQMTSDMRLSIPVIETVKKRRSVRTYAPGRLTDEDKRALMKYSRDLYNPFGAQVKIHWAHRTPDFGGARLGTYGIIRGASAFMGVSVRAGEHALLGAGYEFESLILCATHMGLGTVWLGGTFDRSGFARAMGVAADELFPAISPVGYPASRPSLIEALMRRGARASSRREFGALFFEGDFKTPLTSRRAGDYAAPLEMARLAPSALNAQPWRVVKKGDAYHFYVARGRGAMAGGFKDLDMGIAIAHFHLSALELGLAGRFQALDSDKIREINAPEDTHYVISWIAR